LPLKHQKKKKKKTALDYEVSAINQSAAFRVQHTECWRILTPSIMIP
jgi:hypothetical protein